MFNTRIQLTKVSSSFAYFIQYRESGATPKFDKKISEELPHPPHIKINHLEKRKTILTNGRNSPRQKPGIDHVGILITKMTNIIILILLQHSLDKTRKFNVTEPIPNSQD